MESYRTYSSLVKLQPRFLSYTFEIHNGLKQGDALSPLPFNFILEHAIKSLEEKEGLQLNGVNKLLVYADDVL